MFSVGRLVHTDETPCDERVRNETKRLNDLICVRARNIDASVPTYKIYMCAYDYYDCIWLFLLITNFFFVYI